MEKYFFHHIRRTNGTIDKQIDICATFDEAKHSFRKFMGDYGYGMRQDTDFVSAMITDESGKIVKPYDETWTCSAVDKFYMHRIKKTGEQWDKGIEVKDTFNAAKQSFNSYLGAWAYGYSENVGFVDCRITDSYGAQLMDETWALPEPEPEPEPAPEPEPEEV